MERIDNFMDSKVKIMTIIQYYVVYLPEILKILTPVSILISCLFTIGKLSNNNEITAMKSGGMSLYKLIFPISIIGILLSFGQFYFNGWIVPAANAEKERISEVFLNSRNLSNSVNNLAFRDSPNRNVLMQYYDTKNQKGYKVIIEDFFNNSENNENNLQNKINKKPTISKRIEAKAISWNEKTNSWSLSEVIMRQIVRNNFSEINSNDFTKINSSDIKNSNKIKNSEIIKTEYLAEMPINLNIKHEQLAKMNKKPKEMNFDEMQDYILVLKNGGKDIRKMEIAYRSEQALPLANFIVILFAVSFASVKKRGGMATQIAAAMVIAFSYLIFFEIMKPIGLATNISPILVGWTANILFLIAGIISIIKTKT
jgi:lipopolysaccharide export system permease protein